MAMRLHIIARGKIGRSPESELVDRYLKRISWPTRHTEMPDRGGELPSSDSPCKTIIMDEKGAQLTSVELARLLERWRDERPEATTIWSAMLLLPSSGMVTTSCA